MRDRDRRSVDHLTILTTQVIWFDLYSSGRDPYHYTPSSMNGSLLLRAIARCVSATAFAQAPAGDGSTAATAVRPRATHRPAPRGAARH
jgi:hypothetical protein